MAEDAHETSERDRLWRHGSDSDAVSQCSTLRLDPETRGAMPRAGLRRHALAARLAAAAAAAFAAAAARVHVACRKAI